MTKQPSRKTPSGSVPDGFSQLLGEVKGRIQAAQMRAMFAVNAELVRLYWDIGQMIHQRQTQEGWGAAVIPRLSVELKNELPEIKGFSERNIKSMLAFYRDYRSPEEFVQQAVAQLPSAQHLARVVPTSGDSLLWSIPWGHHVVLMSKVKDVGIRVWYMQQTLANGWSRHVLTAMIDSASHMRVGKSICNFDKLLSSPQSDLVQQTLKDAYIINFVSLAQPIHEH